MEVKGFIFGDNLRKKTCLLLLQVFWHCATRTAPRQQHIDDVISSIKHLEQCFSTFMLQRDLP